MQKIDFLKLGYFIDNEYLERYICLIEQAKLTKYNCYTERHHIIPRSVYNLLNKAVDNSPTNLVTLSFAEHCRAHWLLYFCTVDKLKFANQTAFMLMVCGLEKKISDYTIKDFELLQKLKEQLILESNTFWSKMDDQYLIDNFKNFSDEELAKYLDRTVIAVKARRTLLHLQRFKMTDFTEDEIAFLVENYSVMQCKEIGLLLNRSPEAIAQKCARLGLTKDTRRAWSREELALLQQYAATKSLSEISILLNRTKLSIKQACHKHNIICNRVDLWSDEEINYLKTNYSIMTVVELANKLGRTVRATEHKVRQLKLYKYYN